VGKASRRKAERRALEATSVTETTPNSTAVPGTLNESSVSEWISGRDSTTIEPSEDDRDAFAQTFPGLIDKHFLHRGLRVPIGIAVAIIIVCWVGLLAWLFIQDNAAGRLESAAGITQFIKKAKIATLIVSSGGLLLLGLGFLAGVARWFASWLRG
jgi:hypothetical protein